ncbi:MAG: hypothetical protein ACYCX4_09870 [Bacillota bacterium]
MTQRVICVLEDRPCTDCGECDRCDLDPDKICDDCCLCLGIGDVDYRGIEIDDILFDIEATGEKGKENK